MNPRFWDDRFGKGWGFWSTPIQPGNDDHDEQKHRYHHVIKINLGTAEQLFCQVTLFLNAITVIGELNCVGKSRLLKRAHANDAGILHKADSKNPPNQK